MDVIIEGLGNSELCDKIAELQGILLAGETSSTIDGTTSVIDLNVVRQQLDMLNRQRDALLGRVPLKPRVATMDVGGLF